MGEAIAAAAPYIFLAGAATSAVGAGYSAYSSHQQGKAANQQARAEAAEAERQARLENKRAEIAQIQGEQEAEKRSRILAADIGSTYANFAGNGLLVGGAGKDTLGSVLTTQAAEAQSDISAIRDTTAMNIWTHQANASSLIASAGNRRIAGRNARRAGNTQAWGSLLSGGGGIAMGAGSYYKE